MIPRAVAIEIIQKNEDANDARELLLSLKTSKLFTSQAEILSAPQCAIPTAPKAIASIIIKSARVGILVTLAAYEATLSFKAVMAESSAPSHLSIFSFLPIPRRIMAIQILAT